MLKHFFLSVILGSSLFFAGCQSKSEMLNKTSTRTQLKVNFQEGDLPSLHPHALMIYLRGISLSKTLFEGLTRINEKGEVILAGAESVEISYDRLTYTFKLRNNKWSDGSLVTAGHYERAWKEALSPTSSTSRADLLYMIKNAQEAKRGQIPLDAVGVKAIDDKTLFVELAYPSPYFLELVAQPICAPLVDPKAKEPTQFNGPFQLDKWKKGDYLRLKRNPYFWDARTVSLNKIDVFFVQDNGTAFSLYEKGEIDWIGVPLSPLSAEQISHLKKTNSLRSHPVDRAFWVFLNTQHNALSSPSIRKALSLAVNRSAITKHILIGGEPLKKPLPSRLLPLTSTFSLKEDLSEAKLWFDHGLKDLGMTKESFPPLVISYSQQAGRKQLAEYLQQAWSQAFGIKVQLLSEEWNVLRTNLEKGLFEISGAFEAAFYKDPMELLEKMTSINPNNFSKWIYPLFIEKVSLAKKEKDAKRRMEILAEAESILMEQMPFIPISSDNLLFSHHPHLKGYAFDYVGAIDFSRSSFSE